MQPSSSPLSNICRLREKHVAPHRLNKIEDDYPTNLHNLTFGLDGYRTIVYISAEIHANSLDSGSDPTYLACQHAKCVGVRGDEPAQYISKQLGGDGAKSNVFPLNKKLDITKWKADEQLVYGHVKQGDGRYAKMMYGIDFNTFFADEIIRPFLIHYHFQLFNQDGTTVGLPIEDTLENTSPKLTDDESPFKGEFKIIIQDPIPCYSWGVTDSCP